VNARITLPASLKNARARSHIIVATLRSPGQR
jgi:hypothetical protein